MRLTFNRLLDVESIQPDRVQLVRHQDARAGATTSPYALWVDRDPSFELYQSIQTRQVFRTDEGSLIASFVVTPAAETLFVGLYGIHGVGTAAPGTLDPVGGHDVSGLNLYDLRPDPRLAFYIGKVVIEWGAGYRSWVQRAHKQDKEVVEVRREFREERFPGFVEFETTLSEVARLPRGWRAILASSRGVYLLTCPRTREQYVGSATGEGGFVARWEQHAAKVAPQRGHSDLRLLGEQLLPEHEEGPCGAELTTRHRCHGAFYHVGAVRPAASNRRRDLWAYRFIAEEIAIPAISGQAARHRIRGAVPQSVREGVGGSGSSGVARPRDAAGAST